MRVCKLSTTCDIRPDGSGKECELSATCRQAVTSCQHAVDKLRHGPAGPYQSDSAPQGIAVRSSLQGSDRACKDQIYSFAPIGAPARISKVAPSARIFESHGHNAVVCERPARVCNIVLHLNCKIKTKPSQPTKKHFKTTTKITASAWQRCADAISEPY